VLASVKVLHLALEATTESLKHFFGTNLTDGEDIHNILEIRLEKFILLLFHDFVMEVVCSKPIRLLSASIKMTSEDLPHVESHGLPVQVHIVGHADTTHSEEQTRHTKVAITCSVTRRDLEDNDELHKCVEGQGKGLEEQINTLESPVVPLDLHDIKSNQHSSGKKEDCADGRPNAVFRFDGINYQNDSPCSDGGEWGNEVDPAHH